MKDLEIDDPIKLDLVNRAHFVTHFLHNVLQFSFAFFIRGTYSEKQKENQKQRRMYDHRTALEFELDVRDTALLGFEFIVESFKELIEHIYKTLERMWI